MLSGSFMTSDETARSSHTAFFDLVELDARTKLGDQEAPELEVPLACGACPVCPEGSEGAFSGAETREALTSFASVEST